MMARLTIRNLTNSPFDLEGGVRLPAMGSVTADFSSYYATLLRVSPGVEVTGTADPLDHDGDGKKGGVVDPSPLSEDEKSALLEAMTDAELRELITGRTGKTPHPNAKRETLIKRARGE